MELQNIQWMNIALFSIFFQCANQPHITFQFILVSDHAKQYSLESMFWNDTKPPLKLEVNLLLIFSIVVELVELVQNIFLFALRSSVKASSWTSLTPCLSVCKLN